MQSQNESPSNWTEFTTDGPMPVRKSLVTKEIDQFVKSRDWPKGVRISLVDKGTFIQWVMYRDNINSFDGEDKLQIAQMVNECLSKISADGIPIFTEVKETWRENA